MNEAPQQGDIRPEVATIGSPASYPGMPRWVKVTGMVILVLVVTVVLATVLGLHTPGGPGGHDL